jgi:uncharacterized BrkB/YihY/UPF0761 family membrane protein
MKVWLARVFALLGIVFALLGVLWSLQGADLIHLEPIACVANCEPLTGPSTTWLLTGLATVVIGLIVTIGCFRYLKRERKMWKAQV